ncbi:hypothetical protein O0L34_g14928 [Tuta absoluta]|nr:hypothetical protein O0L34_g14928 [Tuta absoluta]
METKIDHHENHDDPSVELWAKATTMLILGGISIIMGIIPIKLNQRFKWIDVNKENQKSPKIVRMLLGFGGGVLMCTTFLHLLPEVTESVELLMKNNKVPRIHFPIAEVFMCAGFFIMYFVEELVHKKLKYSEKKAAKDDLEKQPVDSLDKENDTNEELFETVEEELVALGHIHQGHSHGHCHGHTHLPFSTTTTANNHKVISSLKGLLIVLGLSVHEMFEGLAIGLEGSANDVWYMFAAVAAHKFVIAFCIGVELVASNTNEKLSVGYVCLFAIVSPLGIGIGMALIGGDCPAAEGPLPVFLQGIATGTLLYVVFFEILHSNRNGLLQYLAILVGFIVMCGLQLATQHHHSHGHDHCREHDHRHGL